MRWLLLLREPDRNGPVDLLEGRPDLLDEQDLAAANCISEATE
ncbi:hypothetical protein [Streptomyces atratus]|nr:hypothetical protein [Streptomyces atratus]